MHTATTASSQDATSGICPDLLGLPPEGEEVNRLEQILARHVGPGHSGGLGTANIAI